MKKKEFLLYLKVNVTIINLVTECTEYKKHLQDRNIHIINELHTLDNY